MDFGPTADERRRLEDAKLKQLRTQDTNDKLTNNEIRRVQAGRVIDDALDKVNQEFDAGFTAYLTGRTPKATKKPDSIQTPGWGNRNVSLMREPSVRNYVLSRQHNRDMFERYIRVMREWGTAIGYDPESGQIWAPTVVEHFLYYKYVLRRPDPKSDTYEYDFEKDFQRWKNQIESVVYKSEEPPHPNLHPRDGAAIQKGVAPDGTNTEMHPNEYKQ